MNEHGLPCRRCGRVSGGATVIYGRDRAGALVPKAAQCAGPCPDQVPKAPARRDSSPRTVTMTAIRPGLCQECGRDIIPGDVLCRSGERAVHYECAPAEAPRPQRRERARVTTVQARGVVV